MNWFPFREMEALRREIDKTLGEFGIGPRFTQGLLPTGATARTYPLINLYETPESVVVEALAPGLDPNSIKVTVARNVLTVAGERPKPNVKDAAFHRVERGYGKFTRTFELPVDIDPDRITAEYKHGILTITMAKTEAAKPRQIEVKLS